MADMFDTLEDGQEMRAAPEPAKVRPAYKVKKLGGTVERTVFKKDPRTRRLTKTVVEEDAGFLLTNMRGDSIRVRTVEELKRLGVSALVPLINTETGEQAGHIEL